MKHLVYLIHRSLFIISGGLYNDILAFLISITASKKDLQIQNKDQFIELLREEKSFLNSMNEYGYYIFNSCLPKETITKISRDISKQKYNIREIDRTDQLAAYEDFHNNPKSNCYDLKTEQLLNIQSLIELSSSQSLVKLAQKYLGACPILDIIVLWWSYPTSDKRLKNVGAQMYHFDMEKIKFIKFFVYLTDVQQENGPHCLIKGSHRKLPINLRKKGRFSDQEVFEAYGEDKEVKITGKAGSIIAVDTRCIHKGDPIIKGSRCIFQLQFSNSTFGKKYEDIKAPLFIKNLKEKNIYNKKIYQMFIY